MPGKKLITMDGSDCIAFHCIPLHRGPRTKYNDGSTKNCSRNSHHHCNVVDGGGVVVVDTEIHPTRCALYTTNRGYRRGCCRIYRSLHVLSIRGFDDTCIAHSVNLEYTNDGDAPLLSILTRPHIRTSVHNNTLFII